MAGRVTAPPASARELYTQGTVLSLCTLAPLPRVSLLPQYQTPPTVQTPAQGLLCGGLSWAPLGAFHSHCLPV